MTAEVELVATNLPASWCCALFAAALEHSATLPEGSRKLAGFVIAHVQDGEGRQQKSRVVYFVPGRGRGKKRVESLYIPVKRCPFCGSGSVR